MILFECMIETNGHGILKNNKQIFRTKSGRSFISSSDRAKSAQEFLLTKLRIEKLRKRIDTITCDLNASFHFIYPKSVYFTKKGHRSNKVADMDNLLQLPFDCLQKSGIISNDSQICSLDGSSRGWFDDNKYYLTIVLKRKE